MNSPRGVKMDETQVVDSLEMRKSLGRFTSGVTIITTTDGTGDSDGVHGMTANAFTSVSLDPPLVLVSIAAKAKMDAKIRNAGRYGISILKEGQRDVALHFAGAANRPDAVRLIWRDNTPLVEGALAHVSCSVYDSHPAGDHTLHVGRVESLWYCDGSPLVFYTGSFRELALVGRDDPWGF